MLRHACRHGAWELDGRRGDAGELARAVRGIIEEHRRLWLARNRPGGLPDSVRRLEECLNLYIAAGS